MKPRKPTTKAKNAPQTILAALPTTISTSELEQLSGIGEKRLRQLATANAIPPAKDGRWQTVSCIKGIIAHYRTASTPDELDRARLAKLEAETKLLNMEAGELDGSLVNFADALSVLLRGHGAMTSAIMGFTDLDIEKRESIILKIREAGDAFYEQLRKENKSRETPN